MALFSNSYTISYTIPSSRSGKTESFYPTRHFLDKENDIWIVRQSLPMIEKYEIPTDTLVAFVNALAFIVDKHDDPPNRTIPDRDWESLEYCLRNLMVRNERGHLYRTILDSYPNAINELNFEAWCHFNMDQSWESCLLTFTTMPTVIFERYLVDEKGWKDRKGTVGENGMKRVYEAISRRTDFYGEDSLHDLPPDLLRDILFNH